MNSNPLLGAFRDGSCIFAVSGIRGGELVSPMHNTNGLPDTPIASGQSWGEWAGLLSFTNLTTSNGAFVQQNEEARASIDTTIDLRGRNSDISFVGKVFLARRGVAEARFLHSVAAQGQDYNGVNRVFALYVWEDNRASVSWNEQLIFGVYTNDTGYVLAANESILDRWICVAATVKYVDGVGVSALYLDGVKVGGKSGVPSFPEHIADSYGTGVQLMNPKNNTFRAVTRMEWCAIYDRALDGDEIRAMCVM